MNTMLVAGAALAVAACANPSPAAAQSASLSAGNTPQGTFQRVEAGSPDGVKTALHWEYQYHYAGHHPHWTGHWVLVR